MEALTEINNLIQERYHLISNNEYNKEIEAQLGKNGDMAISLIQQNKDVLSFEFILESLTHLGYVPSLVYDDNGNFAVCSASFSSVSLTPADATITHFVEKDEWKGTIREALNSYLEALT
jgi:hypothetical protein